MISPQVAVTKEHTNGCVARNCKWPITMRNPSYMWNISSWLPSGKRLHNYGKIHHAIDGKSTIWTGPFSSSQTVLVYQAG